MTHPADRLTLRLAALVVIIALASPLLAQAQMKGKFDDADVNHDGRVTLQEYQAYVTQRLTVRNGPVAQQFKQLSPQEQAARLQQRFETIDSGHKGYLSRSDWSGS